MAPFSLNKELTSLEFKPWTCCSGEMILSVKKNFFSHVVFIVCALAAGISFASPISNMDLRYEVFHGNTSLGYINTNVRQQGKQFTALTESEAAGFAKLLGDSITEKLWFILDNGHYRPLRYFEKRTGRKAYEKTVEIDWGKNKIRFAEGQILPIPRKGLLEAGQIPFSLMTWSGEQLSGQNFHVITHKGVRVFKVLSTAPEVLDTAIGKLQTIKIKAKRVDKGNRFLTFWLATGKNNLPVKIVNDSKGKITTLLLSEFKKKS